MAQAFFICNKHKIISVSYTLCKDILNMCCRRTEWRVFMDMEKDITGQVLQILPVAIRKRVTEVLGFI